MKNVTLKVRPDVHAMIAWYVNEINLNEKRRNTTLSEGIERLFEQARPDIVELVKRASDNK